VRVLIAPEWYPWPEQPGFGSFCRDQAQTAALQHDVVVLAWRADAALCRPFRVTEAMESGLRTFRVRFKASPAPKLSSIYKLLGLLTVLWRLRWRDRWIPQIVHAHEYAAGLPALLLARLARAPVVISEHASDFALQRLEPHQLARAGQVFRRAAVVSPVSNDLAHRLVPFVSDTPVMPVPNATDTRLFVPGERGVAEHIKLLSVGNLVEVKGHRYLIDAVRILRESGVDVSVDILGDGELRPTLEDQAHCLGMHGAVRFHGYLRRPVVAQMMRDADVFVLPSLWENMPCVLLEAMASGLPSVATRVGGVPEIINRSTGVLAEPASATALAAAIGDVIGGRAAFKPNVLHAMAVNRYGYDAVGRQWTEIYELARSDHHHRMTTRGSFSNV
jgi:L-malate glycosyltransferase